MEERRAGLANIAAQLEEARERGYNECARRYGHPQAVSRPLHLSSVPSGGAS
jgi:ribosomal protein S14